MLGITHEAIDRRKIDVSSLVKALVIELVTEGGFSDGILYWNSVGKIEVY